MADNPIKNPLPADLPKSWQYGQTIAPTGEEAGLSKQHGYNYLMEQVNAAQEGVNALGEAVENCVSKAGDTMTGPLALPSLSAGGNNTTGGGIAAGTDNFVSAPVAANGGGHYKATLFQGLGHDTVTLNQIKNITVGSVLYFRGPSRTTAKTVTAVDEETLTITVTPVFKTGEFNSSDLSDAFYDIVLPGTDGGALTVGNQCFASYAGSAALGAGSAACAAYSFAQGSGVKTRGINSHAEGSNTVAAGTASHAEGEYSEAQGKYAHAEGSFASASGDYSHAEGSNSMADGECSHAEGNGTVASGSSSHTEGSGTTASGSNSHAGGNNTVASADNSTIVGKYGETNADTLFAVANGTSANNKSLAFEVKQDGRVLVGGEQVAKSQYSTEDLTAGESALPTGTLYFVYE